MYLTPSIFGEFFPSQRSFSPSFDIIETDDTVQVDVLAPGMNKKDFSIEVEDGLLTISGERKLEKETKDKRYISVESRYGKFSKTYSLPENINSGDIDASYKDGVLSVVLKKKEKEENKLTIEIS